MSAIKDLDMLALLRTIIDNLPSGVSLMDKDLRFIAGNAEFRRLLDFPDELFEPQADLAKLVRFNILRGEYGTCDPEAQTEAIVERARRMLPHVFERVRPDGTVLEIRGRPLPGGGFVTIYTDMTARKRVEEEARQTAAYLRAVMDNLPLGVLLVDKEMRCVYWNKLGRSLFDLGDEFEIMNAPLAAVLFKVAENGGYGPGLAEEQVARRMALIAAFEPHTVELERLGGGTLQVRGAPIMSDSGPAGFILLQEDITERKNYQATLERLATTDYLTGLLNRRAFLDASGKEIRRAHRYGQPMSLLMIDVDHFKSINDTWGHPIGDEVLRAIGAACKAALRDEDIAGRLGGEEFAVTLIQAPLRIARSVAERLRNILGGLSIDVGGKPVRFTVSIGVAELGPCVETIEKLISVADEGLYSAKHLGRNRVVSPQDRREDTGR